VRFAFTVCYYATMPERGETSLEMAVRHVAEARRIVVQQRERMASLKADGHSTVDHEKTLEVLETTLRIFEHDERSIRERMGIPK
jgi:hypothetical protein